MRESEVQWHDQAIEKAAERASDAAARVLIESLAIAFADAPASLVDHPQSKKLRSALGMASA